MALRMRSDSPIEAATRSTSLMRLNPDRKGLTVYNKSQSNLYIDFDDSVSITNFMVLIPPSGYWESPNACTDDLFGIWETAEGVALVREFVPR
jgi:hypothetical protein